MQWPQFPFQMHYIIFKYPLVKYTITKMDIVTVDDTKSRALTTAAASSSSGKVISKEQVQWLREQREHHKYKTIWTKDPHGGPYRKVGVVLTTCFWLY